MAFALDYTMLRSPELLVPRLKPVIGFGEIDHAYLRSHPQMRGCVAWWPMLEGAGNTLHDVIGGNNGTINGALWTPRGLDFDGSNDHVDVGDNLDQTGSFTISAWIKPETIGYATGGRLVVKDDHSGAGDGWAFTLADLGDGALRFFIRNASPASTDTATGVIDALTWYHVVARFDADENTKSIYVNAVREAHDTGVTGGPVNNSNALGFARDPDGTSGDPYDGILNDVRIYPRPLSESEIQDLYYDPWASIRPL